MLGGLSGGCLTRCPPVTTRRLRIWLSENEMDTFVLALVTAGGGPLQRFFPPSKPRASAATARAHRAFLQCVRTAHIRCRAPEICKRSRIRQQSPLREGIDPGFPNPPHATNLEGCDVLAANESADRDRVHPEVSGGFFDGQEHVASAGKRRLVLNVRIGHGAARIAGSLSVAAG